MSILIRNWFTLVWLIITGATALSWWLAQGLTTDTHDSSNMWTTITVMVIAYIKVRLVIMHFMEVRTAPLPLRLVCETWLLASCSSVIILYALRHTV